nr:MAG TPA: hypothetical protein [Podoviridae sp. ctY3D12]
MFTLSLFVIAVRFSVVIHRRDLHSSYSPYASCSSRQFTDIVQSASCQTLRTLCNVLLYAGVHSRYLIIYREP